MDINIDGASSTYKKDDPRGIHVGHSIYFADSYDDIINKYTDGETEIIPTETAEAGSPIGIKSITVIKDNEIVEDASVDWTAGPVSAYDIQYEIIYYPDDSDVPTEETLDAYGAKITIVYGKIKYIKIRKLDEWVNPPSISNKYPAFKKMWILCSLENDSTTIYTKLNDIYSYSGIYANRQIITYKYFLTHYPTSSYRFAYGSVFGIDNVPGTSNYNVTDCWCKHHNKWIVNGHLYIPSNPWGLAFSPSGARGFLGQVPTGGEITVVPRFLDYTSSEWRDSVFHPEEININAATMITTPISYSYKYPNNTLTNTYDLFDGSYDTSSNTPFYNESTGDQLFPANVALKLNSNLYTHYATLAYTGPSSSSMSSNNYKLAHWCINGAHYILNGAVNYDGDSALYSMLYDAASSTNTINGICPLTYSLIPPYQNTSEMSSSKSYYRRVSVNAGKKIIIYFDDPSYTFQNNNLFDITIKWEYRTSEYSSEVVTITYNIVHDENEHEKYYVITPPTTNSSYINLMTLSFGYSGENPLSTTEQKKYLAAIDRTGLTFNNFKFSIYISDDPSDVIKSTIKETKTTSFVSTGSSKNIVTTTGLIESTRSVLSNNFLNLLPRGCYNTWDDFHLIPTSRPIIAPPSVKTNTIDLPGGNGVLDLSYSLTKCPLYDNRKGSLEFIVDPDQDTWINVYQKLSNYLDGRYRYMTLEDDPYWVYEGKFMVNDWQSDEHWSTITIDYDVKPYKRYILKTDPDQSLSTGRTKIPYYDELKSTFMGIGALSINNPEKVLLNVDLYSTIPVCPSFTVRFGAVRITITRIENQVYIDEPISVSQKLGNHVKIISTYDTEKPKDVYNPIYVNDLSLMFQGQCTLQVQALDNTVIPQVDVIFRPGIL